MFENIAFPKDRSTQMNLRKGRKLRSDQWRAFKKGVETSQNELFLIELLTLKLIIF